MIKNIFVYSSSYLAYIFVHTAEYLLNIPIGTFNLLTENNTLSEFGEKANKIKLFDDIDECIMNSDIIIILDNHNLPNRVISKLSDMASKYNKILINIDTLLGHECEYERTNYIEKVPAIFNISIGNYSANFCIEMMLNRIFTNDNINFRQEFSAETLSFLQQLQRYGILHYQLENQLFRDSSAYEILIKTINYNSFYDMTYIFEKTEAVIPDYFILNTSYRFTEYNAIEKLIYYKYSAPLFLIKSNYVEIYRAEKSMKCVYCVEKQKNINYINDNNLEQKLKFDIFSKMTLPADIYILH